MANPEHVERLKKGIKEWNEWRTENRAVTVDLTSADLTNLDLSHANLSAAYINHTDFSYANLNGADLSSARLVYAKLIGANLQRANLIDAILEKADLTEANLSRANLREADLRSCNLNAANLTDAFLKEANLKWATLSGANLTRTTLIDGKMEEAVLRGANMKYADLTGANLRYADLNGADLRNAHLNAADLRDTKLVSANLASASLVRADLSGADLSGADLSEANLQNSILVETNLHQATLTGCKIYGISAWNLNLDNTIQNDLVISMDTEPVMTVDNLSVAQFIYLMLNNKNIRNVLNAITSKGVLILGRFSDPERKAVLDGLREKLRLFDLLPMVFDFDRPTDKDYTETIQTLAGMSMFVIADLTSPKSTPLELEATVKHFKIPYIPIIDTSIDSRPFAMLVDLQNSFHWVLPALGYKGKDQLLSMEVIKKYIIDPVNKKREELRNDKSAQPEMILITDITT